MAPRVAVLGPDAVREPDVGLDGALRALAPGDPRTVCDWLEGSAALLPPADLVRLSPHRVVPRASLTLEQVDGELPPRWRGVWPG